VLHRQDPKTIEVTASAASAHTGRICRTCLPPVQPSSQPFIPITSTSHPETQNPKKLNHSMDRGGAQTGGANSLEGRKNQKLSGEESLYSGAVEEVQEAEEGRNHCWLNILHGSYILEGFAFLIPQNRIIVAIWNKCVCWVGSKTEFINLRPKIFSVCSPVLYLQ
jgi:hypothetical protein